MLPVSIPSFNNEVPKCDCKRQSFLTCFKPLVFAIFLLGVNETVFAQHDTAQQKSTYDSATREFDSATNELINSLKKSGIDVERKNLLQYNEDTIATKQDAIIGQLREITSEAKTFLKNAFDTTEITTALKDIAALYDITIDGVFTNTGTTQTNRNLAISNKILKELLARTLEMKSLLEGYHQNLTGLRNKIDSLDRETVLYKLPSDSVALIRYARNLIVLSREIKPVDTALRKSIFDVAELRTTVSRFQNTLNSSIEEIEIYQRQLSNKAFKRDVTNLGAPIKFSRPFIEIINFSRIKGILAFTFYVQHNIARIVILFILVFISTIFLKNLKRSLRTRDVLDKDLHGFSVLKYPFLSSLLIVLIIFQFIFPDPPFAFSALIWTIAAVCLTIIFRNYISRYWMLAWLIMLFLFFLASADNFVLQASRTERWIMLVLSILGILSGAAIIFFASKHWHELREKQIIYFIGFLVLMQIASVFANIYGRYNLAKGFLTAGFINVTIAILFFWTVRSVNESLFLAKETYQIPDKKFFYINFNKIGGRAPSIFYVFLIIGWFILFARNFYIYRRITDPVKDFVYQTRTIQNFTFSIGSILEFFLILFLAGLTSRIVSFFASDRYTLGNGQTRKGGVGNWLLIIRISIMSVGILLAFAAAGIPMDRLTIILSALSVGIGFGLQTLVNNLVSGLIISFEKPVTVGDIIEIGGQSGTVKSIGLRSSMISIPNGSDMVIPNGDLLNQHLVNWTHDNTFRSVEVPVSVAYGTNLQNAIQVLKDLPIKDERILSNPPPAVIIKDLNSSSIIIQLSFWVKDIALSGMIKSDIILAIDAAFKKNDIHTPVPLQDVRILTVAKDGFDSKSEIEKK
jgi:potassium-dependent mechanosensitive channel